MKQKHMKKASSKAKARPRHDEMNALAVMREDEIDTGDIPEVLDWSGAKRGLFYRPIKQQLTLRIDADVVAWFRGHAGEGRGYQTNINRALREYVQQREKKGIGKRRAAAGS
jgi:uncharacterized protein (DUF4415 family)